MSRDVYRRSLRNGQVSADIFRPAVADIAALSALAPSDVWDGSLIHVKDVNTIFSYDLDSSATADGVNIISPATGVGRWLKINFAGTSSGTADKWVDVTRITSTETVTVDKTSADDWPQEVVRENIQVDGTLNVVDGYVIVAPFSVVRIERHPVNMPEAPNNTVEYKGWAAYPCVLKKIKVLCVTANTQGTLILTITNNATGNSVLSTATLNINSTAAATAGVLTDDTLYTATLTGTSTDLAFP